MAELDLGMVRPALVDNLTSTRTDAALTAKQGKTLKDAIDATQAVTSGTGTKVSSHITEYEYARWSKVGRVCEVQAKFRATEITDNTEVLFTGFPVPNNSFALVLAHDDLHTNGAIIRLRILSTGVLCNGYTTGGIPAGDYECWATYITKD